MFLLALLLGCGGGEPQASEPGDAQGTSGGEDVGAPDEAMPGDLSEPEEEPELAAEPEPEPTGPAHLTVTVKVGFQAMELPVRILGEDGDEVASGTAGQPFTLPAGDYTVAVAVTDAHLLADRPERQEAVSLAPGEDGAVEIEFPRAQVRLHVRRNGRELRGARVELRHAGSDETVVDFRTGNDYLPISAGRYTAVVHAARQEITVNDMIFMEGSSRDMPIDIN